MICFLLLFSLALVNAKFMQKFVGRTLAGARGSRENTREERTDNWGPKLTNEEKSCPFLQAFVTWSSNLVYELLCSAQMKLSDRQQPLAESATAATGAGLAGMLQILSIRHRRPLPLVAPKYMLMWM